MTTDFDALIQGTKNTDQRRDYHPEGDVYRHTAFVFGGVFHYGPRRFRGSQMKELKMVALYHDLGKVDTTKPQPNHGRYLVAYGHDNVSARIFDHHRDNIDFPDDVRPDVVRFLIKNHMRIKQLDNMRDVKAVRFQQQADDLADDVWDMLLFFNGCDDMLDYMDRTSDADRQHDLDVFGTYVNHFRNNLLKS